MKKSLFIIFSLLLLWAWSVKAQISGTVFSDYNMDGIRTTASTGTTPNEPLAAGVIVTVYDATGTVLASYTTTSTSAPNFSIPSSGTAYNGTLGSNTGFVTSGTAVRLEFTTSSTSCPTDNFSYSSRGNTSIQFLTAPSTTVLYGLNNPANYNTGTTGVNAFLPCYVNGDPLAGGTSGSADWFVGFPYTNSASSAVPSQHINGATIGAVWGVAYSKQATKVFTSAFLKRHAGYGTLGSGGIYLLTPTASSFTATPFFDMDNNSFNTAGSPVTRTRADATAPTYGNGTSFSLINSNRGVSYLGTTDPLTGQPLGLGVVGTNAQRGLSADKTVPSYDGAAFDQIGKVGLGGIDISDDGKYLFVINLYQRKLFRLELNSVSNPTSVVSVTSYALPSTSCTNGELRPFAVKYYKGSVYVGAVCTGEYETTNANTNLASYVFQLSNATASASFVASPVLTTPLTYTKGIVNTLQSNSGNRWYPWVNDMGKTFTNITNATAWLAQPIFSDIEFTERGDMILSYMDRIGHQVGWYNYYNLGGTSTATVYTETGGDLLIAGANCPATFTMESGGKYVSNGVTRNGITLSNGEGPGGGEFFSSDFFNNTATTLHLETSLGATAVIPGTSNVMSVVFDPLTNGSTGGVHTYSTVNGGLANAYQVYSSPTIGTYGKANGLGGVDLSLPLSPIEIGNRVWDDTDKDGIQDAGETGIAGVQVQLFLASNLTTPIATATTDVDGTYYFSSATGTNTASTIYGLTLTPNTNYVLKFPTTTGGKNITVINSGTNDLIDSDANASTGQIAFTLGSAGQNDHSFDVGYSVSTCTLPTATASATTPTCTGSTANSDGRITIAGFTTGQRYQYSTGNTFTSGSAIPASITTIPVGGVIANTLANTTQSYTVRIYDATDDACFVDRTVNITAVTCNITCTPPNAGLDVTICLPKTTLNLADASSGTAWSVGTGNPATATINATTGEITGLTTAGTYKFILTNTADATCKDEMQVIVTAGDAPIALCNDGSTSYTLVAQSNLTNVIWYNMAGQQVGTGANLIVTSNTSGLADGSEAYYFIGQDGSASGCDVELCCPVKFITQSCCPTPNCVGITVIKN